MIKPIVLLTLLLLGASPAFADQIVWVPYTDTNGGTYKLYARLCRPDADRDARVVVIAHGSPANASVRPSMQPLSCESETARWFVRRGYLVIAAMRTGYGQTGGTFLENIGACSAAEYIRSGRETARQIAATVEFATGLPGARRDGAVVVGQSAGGWGAVAFDAIPHPKVSAIVSMAGGRGGHVGGQANHNCRPDQLALAAGTFGADATTPMMWVYTENDSFFDPGIASSLYSAFSQSGGRVNFMRLGAFGSDGHSLFHGRGGSAIWGPLMEHYLASRLGASP